MHLLLIILIKIQSASRICLPQALQAGLLTPFQYLCISDDTDLSDESLWSGQKYNTERLADKLCAKTRAQLIVGALHKYLADEYTCRALCFCVNKRHADFMAEQLRLHGFNAQSLTSDTTNERRKDLAKDLRKGTLHYLCVVDIFNEGVDIPGVNMVLFLRPTESSTIFIQQLGRGLRKYPGKDYVTILDFIGNNYKRSVHIALALGSLSKNSILEKKLLKSMILNDFKPLGLDSYGVKISIDSLSKEEIVESIENENFNSLRYMKTDYLNFKNYLNSPSYPKHMDYLNSDYAPNLLKFMKIKIKGRKTESYYNFLKGIEEDNLPLFSSEQVNVVNYLSSLLPLVRRHEYVIVQRLLGRTLSKDEIHVALLEEIPDNRIEQTDHALRFLAENDVIVESHGVIKLNCDAEPEFKEFVADLLEYGITDFIAR